MSVTNERCGHAIRRCIRCLVARLIPDIMRVYDASRFMQLGASIEVPNLALDLLWSDEWRARRVVKKRELGLRRYSGTESGPWSSSGNVGGPVAFRAFRATLRRTRALLLTLCSFVCTGCTTATWRPPGPPGPPSRECARLKYRIFNCCHNNENLTADISRVTSGEARLYIAFLVYVTFSLHLLHM